jgi:hypothetical protein
MSNGKKWQTIFQYGIAAIIILGFIALLTILVFHLAPDGNQTLLNVMVGQFAGMTALVVGYYFASSKSSSDKNEMLLNADPKKDEKN